MLNTITVTEGACHPETCLDVTHSSGHSANVNPVGESTDWRVDCDHCQTCVRIRPTKAEALEVAKKHVKFSIEDYWLRRNLGVAD